MFYRNFELIFEFIHMWPKRLPFFEFMALKRAFSAINSKKGKRFGHIWRPSPYVAETFAFLSFCAFSHLIVIFLIK